MTDTPDTAELHDIAEQMVRHIAAGTGLTTVATVGMGADGIPVVARTGFSPHSLDASYGRLLDALARMQRRDPRGVPADACALILPERDVAYLHYPGTGDGLAQVLVVGRNPVADPTTHLEVSRGLATLMQALTDTQPPHRPTGSAFLADPSATVTLLAPPPQRPPGYRGRHR